jgi:hypothetical protein
MPYAGQVDDFLDFFYSIFVLKSISFEKFPFKPFIYCSYILFIKPKWPLTGHQFVHMLNNLAWRVSRKIGLMITKSARFPPYLHIHIAYILVEINELDYEFYMFTCIPNTKICLDRT